MNKIGAGVVRFYFFLRSWFLIRTISKEGNVVLLLGAPYHRNLGDHAQTYCTEKWINQNFSNRLIITMDTRSLLEFNGYLISILKKYVNSQAIIFLHSGYHTTDLYPLENTLQKEIVSIFLDNKIIIMPQTIHYIDKSEQQRVSDIFNAHNNLTMLCRDEKSYLLAKKVFSHTQTLLFPDIVTIMIGQYIHDTHREGVNLCLRNDKESLYGDQLEELRRGLSVIGPVSVTDTNSKVPVVKLIRNLENELHKCWREFANYNVTVTDRYHGTIFSLISGTPVVVLSSTDHKLESGVKWFPKKFFGSYIYYATDIDSAIKKAEEFAKLENHMEFPKYFNDQYYAKLKAKLNTVDE